MARPKDADSAVTYDAIIQAALDLLAQLDGPADLSLRKVGDRAGVSLGTIQYYFASKEVLVESCLDGYYERMAELARQLLEGVNAPARDPREVIEEAVRALYRFTAKERRPVELRLASNAKSGQLHPARQADFMGVIIRSAAKVMSRLVQVSDLDTRLSIQAAASMVVRMALLTDSELRFLTDLEGDEARDAVEDFVVRAARRLVRPLDG